MRILVIDDNQTHRDAAKIQLAEHDLTVVGTYDNGRELLQDKHDFEVVLTDLLMPASSDKQGDGGLGFVGQEMPIGIFLGLLAAKNGAKLVAIHSDADHHSHPASACFDAFSRYFWKDPSPNSSRCGWSHDECKPHPIEVCGAKMILSNNRNWVFPANPETLERFSKEYDDSLSYEERCEAYKFRVKDWSAVLEYLNTL